MKAIIRPVEESDLEALKEVIATSDLFPPEMLKGMMQDYLECKSLKDIWLTGEVDEVPVAVSFCAPERMTEGTFNLFLIAVHSDHQGKGLGEQMMRYIENFLEKQEGRILLVETSGSSEFELARKFYDKCGFTREAVIREFYQEGDDKVIFWK